MPQPTLKLALLLMAMCLLFVWPATAQDNGDSDDSATTPDDDLGNLLSQRIRGSLNEASQAKGMAELEAKIRAQLSVEAAAGLTLVQQATAAFMQEQTTENEQTVLQRIQQFVEDHGLEGDGKLIAQKIVSEMKQQGIDICWACPGCAIFAGPLSLTFPLLHSSMKGRCSSNGPISATMKGQLACHFPSLNLNSVTVYWGCTYLNEDVFGGHDIGMVPAGQTFGNDIFMKKSTKDDPASVGVVMHELVHVKQYKDYGGDISFGFKYLYHFCLKGFKYGKIDEEVAAYNFANNRPLCVTKSPTAPTYRAPTKAPTKKPNGAYCTSDSQCQSGKCEEIQLPKVEVMRCVP